MNIFFFLVLFFLYPLSLFAQLDTSLSKVEKTKLYTSKEWLRLLHLNINWAGSYSSDIEDKNYFLSSPDSIDPQKEMINLIKQNNSQSQNITDKSARCLFPARIKWLVKQDVLNPIAADLKNCKKYQEFIKKYFPEDIYVVFSSYFLESPGSAFGHTFLRLNHSDKYKNDKHSELLDTGISYGAQVTTENPALYAIFGMFGGFQGNYSALPYFYKIREYNDFESRDLWSYRLKLTNQQIKLLMDHLWEVGNTSSPYFFFTKNCSYSITTLLEAINPDWHIRDQLYFYTIPADTIIAMNKIGILDAPLFRPSIKKVFERSYNQLNIKEKESLTKLIETRDINSLTKNSPLTRNSKKNILDTLINYVDFKFANEILRENGEIYKWKNKVLQARSSLPISQNNTKFKVPHIEAPHRGHKVQRLDLYAGHDSNRKSFTELSFRLSLHDLLDPIAGEPTLAGVTFFKPHFRFYTDDNKLSLRRLTILEVETLNPWEFKHYPISFYARVGYDNILDGSCIDDCHAPVVEFRSGLTFKLGAHSVLQFYSKFLFSGSDKYLESWGKVAIGPGVLILNRFSQKVVHKTIGFWQRSFVQKINFWTIQDIWRYHYAETISFELSLEKQNDNESGHLGIQVFL